MIVWAKPKSRSSVLETYSVYLLVAWTIIIVGILLFGIFQIRHIQQEMVKKEAQANFNKDQALRFWSTTHGGVYVPVTETTPSNPYLSHVKERDIRTPDGKALTLMNPSYMLRQTMEEYETLYGVRGHLTSLKYFRSETAPDEWEKFALQKFKKGTKEIFEFTKIDGKPYYRYMSPVITKIGCLKCHGHQGYKVGDVRGGVSVSIPMTFYLISQRKQTVTLAVSMAILWFIGFYGLILANRGLNKRVRERDSAEAKLQEAHDKLEREVEERTSELNNELQERKQAEAAVRKSEEKFRSIFRTSPDAINLNSAEGGIYMDINEGFTKIMGYSRENIIGKSSSEFNIWNDPKDRELLVSGLKKWGVVENLEANFIGKDGQIRTGLMSARLLNINNKDTILSIIRDITEQRKLETQLQKSKKMESIGILAGGIAHDFNNILFPIIGHTEMLLEDAPEDSPFRDSLYEIYTGAMRASELVKQILTFSSQDTNELKLMKMQPIIKEALRLIRPTIPTTIEFKQNITTDNCVIKADPTQIHQIVMNLAINSYHAMEDTGGELKVNLKKIELGEPDVLRPDMKPGMYACLTIADTGKGMNKALKEKIFDPFFTTKEVGKGIGMGLSTVYGIVKNMNGVIRVYSEPGEGTQFHVYLPVEKSFSEKQVTNSKAEIQGGKEQILIIDDEPGEGTQFHVYLPVEKSFSEKQVTNSKAEIQGGKEQILIIDDEPQIRLMLKKMLEAEGFNVITASDGKKGMDLFIKEPVDLVITDIIMPEKEGVEVIQELRKGYPEVPIIAISGGGKIGPDHYLDIAKLLGANAILKKPIKKNDLLNTVKNVLKYGLKH